MNTRSAHIPLLGGLAALLLALPAWALEYALQWPASDDAQVAGYRVYQGTSHRDYDVWLDVGDAAGYAFTDLEPDRVHYFAVTAYDAEGQESAFSNEATSGRFRYVVGLGAGFASGGRLQVDDMYRLPEQDVAVGWPEYNLRNGEARASAGDLDGDGRDEVVVGFAPVDGEIPGGRFQVLDDDFSHLAWGQLDWADYNAFNGETRPALGDLDGDGVAEILIGLGDGGGGAVALFRFSGGSVVSIGWTEVAGAEGVWPAAGDLDGDGRDELVVGLGHGGVFVVKSEFDPMLLDAGSDPWLDELTGDVAWAEFAASGGETRPAAGDVDGDGRAEVLVGLGPAGFGDGHVAVFDFRAASLTAAGWAAVDWPEYNASNGETRPALGDVDADGRDEVIIGLGAAGEGYLELLDDAASEFASAGTMLGPYGSAERAAGDGTTWPAFKREHASAPGAPDPFAD